MGLWGVLLGRGVVGSLAAFQGVGAWQPSRGWAWRGPQRISLSLLPQVCSKREKRLADPTLEKYVLTVVLDTINAFFSSPFSENSTSLQVSSCAHSSCAGQGGRRIYIHVCLCIKT